MESPRFNLLRCLLCCQDEFDDFLDVDLYYIRRALYSIKNLLKRPFLSQPNDEASVRIIPTQVQHNSSHQRSSYAHSSAWNHSEVSEDLETKLIVAFLQRSRISSESPSRPAQSLLSSSSSSSSERASTASSKSTRPSVFAPSPSSPKPADAKSQSHSSYKAPHDLPSSLSFSGSNPSSQKHDQTVKPALERAASRKQGKAAYSLVGNDALPLYIIPERVKDLIKNDITPDVLKKPLSAFTYKEYFSVLLYAEDYYYEKWSDYKLLNVTVELHDAAVYMKPDQKKKFHENEETEDKIFVAFKVDNIPERRPYLLSRDLAYAQPSGCEVEPFQRFGASWRKNGLIPS